MLGKVPYGQVTKQLLPDKYRFGFNDVSQLRQSESLVHDKQGLLQVMHSKLELSGYVFIGQNVELTQFPEGVKYTG
jgi:hypothetical protein